jgi:hypothetical protein
MRKDSAVGCGEERTEYMQAGALRASIRPNKLLNGKPPLATSTGFAGSFKVLGFRWLPGRRFPLASSLGFSPSYSRIQDHRQIKASTAIRPTPLD